MLKIIESKDKGPYKQKVESLLNQLKIYQNFHLSRDAQAIFIIAEDSKRGVYGGAVLYPQKVNALYEKISRVLLTLQPEREEIWSAKLCFCAEPDDKLLTLETLNFFQDFYQNLHKALIEIGDKKGIDFLALSLPSSTYHDIRTYGSWSYILELRPCDSSDYCFHGLLSLKDEKHKLLRQKDRSSL